jgi:hypothetical protein
MARIEFGYELRAQTQPFKVQSEMIRGLRDGAKSIARMNYSEFRQTDLKCIMAVRPYVVLLRS